VASTRITFTLDDQLASLAANSNDRSDSEDGSKPVVKVVHQDFGESTGLLAEYRSVDQFEAEGDRYRILWEPAFGGGKQDISSDTCSGEVGGDGDHVGLPDTHA
jgi:hypothetical protein